MKLAGANSSKENGSGWDRKGGEKAEDRSARRSGARSGARCGASLFLERNAGAICVFNGEGFKSDSRENKRIGSLLVASGLHARRRCKWRGSS